MRPTILFILAVLFSSSVAAADVSDVAAFLAGGAAGVAIHESAHGAGALAMDRNFRYVAASDHAGYETTGHLEEKDGLVAGAGLVAQMGFAEIGHRHDGLFWRGAVWGGVVHSLLYVADYWWIGHANHMDGHRPLGDIQVIEHVSGKTTADLFAATLAAWSAWLAWRDIHRNDPPEVSIKPMPVPGGMGAALSMRF